MGGAPEVGKLAPEQHALHTCARVLLQRAGHDDLATALASCVSSERLCDKAVQQGMLGHLHRLVAGEEELDTDPILVQRVTERQSVLASRNLRQTAHLVRVLEELETVGVTAMPYKGPVWAETLYGDIALRTWIDLDVIVTRDQLGRAREVLLGIGYVDADRFNTAFLRRRRGSWGELEFHSPAQGSYVELHWEVSVSIGSRPLRAEELLARSGTVSLLKRTFRAPSWTDAILIDCIHGAKHEWDRVEQMLGLGLRIEETAGADWPLVVAAAKEAGCMRRVCAGVAHICRVFDLTTPPEILDGIAGDSVARAYVRFLETDSSSGPSKVAGRDLAGLVTRFATEDSLLASMRHALIRLFYPGREDWEAFALPSSLRWLYYILRPGRLALKWSRRLLQSIPGRFAKAKTPR